MPTLGAPITQQDWSALMVQQLQLLNPRVSAQVGTPERDLVDTLAGALASAQIDVGSLQNSNSVDSKVGTNLTLYTSLFGFQRKRGTYATGIATFSTSGTATQAIPIPYGTQVLAQPSTTTQIPFDTTQNAVIPVGATSVDVPIRAEIPGASGQVDANTIIALGNASLIPGITSVTNAAATVYGSNQESDAELKVRFKNTVFRNVSGTNDQYLATGLSGLYTTKANVIGPISRYREYIQVPTVDDSQVEFVNNGQGFSIPVTGNGNAGQYTTALSSNPYAKYIFANTPAFVSNGALDSSAIFYQPGLDWVLNTTIFSKDRGDAYRFWYAVNQPKVAAPDPITVATASNASTALATGTYNYVVTAYLTRSDGTYGETDYVAAQSITIAANQEAVIQFALEDHALGYNIYRQLSGTWTFAGSVSAYTIDTYSGGYPGFIDSGQNTPGTTNASTGTATPPTTNTAVLPFNDVSDPTNSPYNPSVSFLNVYTGSDPSVQAVRPGDVCLFEWSYTSTESRNDVTRNVTNAVDLYVDGQNPTTASTTLPMPKAGVNTVTTTATNSPTYIGNFRRVGESQRYPSPGNIIQTLYYTPVLSLPSSITTSYGTYYKNVHYFAIQEVDQIGSTIRARDGIEWNPNLPSQIIDPSGVYFDPAPDANGSLPYATLESALTNGTAYTQLTISPLSGAMPKGGSLVLVYGANAQTWTLSQSASAGATVVNVNSLSANYSYPVGSNVMGTFTGPTILQDKSTSLLVGGYQYDKNVVDLQSAIEGVKQTTTDALVHSAQTIYLKMDFTVAYTPGSNPNTVNAAIQNALSSYLSGQYFGSLITLSSLLGIVYNTQGVANVRWTHDIDDTKPQVQFVDVNGNPITQIYFYRSTIGQYSTAEVQSFYVVGNPVGGTFQLTFGDQTSSVFAWQNYATLMNQISSALSSFGTSGTVAEGAGGANGGSYLQPGTVTFNGYGQQPSRLGCISSLIGNQFSQTNDFYLKDSQLPALPVGQIASDTLPGLIIRQRSQDIWNF